MKVFLRDRKTRLYSAGTNEWVASVGQALDFETVAQATRLALDGNWPDLEMVVRYDVLPEEVAVPILAAWRDAG